MTGIFHIFPRKYELLFHANRPLGDDSHEMLIAIFWNDLYEMSVLNFWEKIRKYLYMYSANIKIQRVKG